MGTVLIAGFAVACILTAVEGLLITLGKWRGLLAVSLAFLACWNLDVKWSHMVVYTLAATFTSLTLSIAVEQLFTGTSPRQARGLPNRVDRL